MEVEGPVHISEVIKRVKDSCNMKRAGANLKKAVNGAISASEDAGNIIKIGDFLYDSASNMAIGKKSSKCCNAVSVNPTAVYIPNKSISLILIWLIFHPIETKIHNNWVVKIIRERKISCVNA